MIKQRHFKSLNNTVFKLILISSVVAMISFSRYSYAELLAGTDSVTTNTVSGIASEENISDIKNYEFQVDQSNDPVQYNNILNDVLVADLTDEITDIPLNAISPDTLKTFVKVIDITRRAYIEPVNDEKLFTNAMQGILKNLDPYAEFLDSKNYESLKAFTQGDIAQVGITAIFNQKSKQWIIESIEKASPADSAGIEVGFYLHKINGTKLNQRTDARDMEQLLQGMAGSMLEIVASNKGRRKQKYILQRNLMTEQSVNVAVKKGIAVVSIPSFQDSTKSQILDGLVALQNPIMGVVLDLRDNPGGLLDSAIEISSLFQSDVDVVKIEYRDGKQTLLRSHGNSHLKKVPIIILQNRYSASAAEVLASSLQYTGRAKVVGEVSYGKGTVQSIIPINNDQAIKLTTAKYLQADGKQINGIGIIPNIELVGDDGINNNIISDNGHSNENPKINTATTLNHLNIRVNNVVYTNINNNEYEKNANNKFVFPMNSEGINEYQRDWQTQAVDILISDINALAKKEGRLPKAMKITSPTVE